MKAMILAAGEGTRLHPLTYSFPKPLVPIVNRPVMEHILLWLRRSGITEVIINTHYLAQGIEDYFGNGSKFQVAIHYSREDRLWGTAGGVKRAQKYFSAPFLVIGGDDLSDVNLAKLIAFHHEKKAIAVIGLKEVEDSRQYGVVVTGSHGKILQFQEKPELHKAKSKLANTGIYIFTPGIFDYIPNHEVFDFARQVFPLLLEKHADFYGCPVDGYWCDIGSLTEYKESHWDILEERCAVSFHGNPQSSRVWIEEPVEIHSTAILKPPCVIGKGTKVEENVVLSGHVVLGRNTVVEAGASLDHVIAWDECTIQKNTVLHDCVVTKGALVAEGQHYQEKVLT